MTWAASPWAARPWAAGPAAAAAPSGFVAAWARYANTLIGHSMKKNVASQVIGCAMVSATDGSAFTGAVTVYVTGNGGTQAAGSVGAGACTHEGNGFHTYTPAQAETDYDHVAFTFVGTGAVPATVQAYPAFPQTGDAFARLGAPGGASVSADVAAVKAETAAILLDTAEIGAAGAGLTALAQQASMNLVGSIVDEILLDTAVIGAAGAGLTALATAAALTTVDTVVDAIKVKTDYLPSATAGAAGGVFIAGSNAATTVDVTGNITGNISGSVGSVTGAVGSVTGAVGSVTGTVQANVASVDGSAPAAANLKNHALRAVAVTFSAGGTTTTAVLDQVDGAAASATNDVYNGRVLVFSGPAGLKDQATNITAYNGATKTATFPALTAAVGATATAVLV